MALKIYTITKNGKANRNTITQPFTIEVQGMQYLDEENEDSQLIITTCTKNGGGTLCINDDIPQKNVYRLPVMTSSKNTDLSELETDLEAKYPGKWS